jgi:hypothetical protein
MIFAIFDNYNLPFTLFWLQKTDQSHSKKQEKYSYNRLMFFQRLPEQKTTIDQIPPH